MTFFSRLKARFRWQKETKGPLAEIATLSRVSRAGLRELASLLGRLDRLFLTWQLADLVGDELASTEAGIEIAALQDRRDLLLTRENELQFAIARLQKSINEKTWEDKQRRADADAAFDSAADSLAGVGR